MKTFIIAEAGSNHEGKLDKAKRLIHLAYAVGCNAVKFQFCSSYEKLADKRKTKIFYPFSIDQGWIPELVQACKNKVEFMCSCYLKEDIKVIEPWVGIFKVASFEANDQEFVFAHPQDRITLVSNGTYYDGMVKNLYCCPQYPCPDEQLKLQLMFDEDYQGLSDHSKNPLTGALAAAMGAEFIEFHLKLADTSPDCPDFEVARNPNEAHEYVRNIRAAEVLLG